MLNLRNSYTFEGTVIPALTNNTSTSNKNSNSKYNSKYKNNKLLYYRIYNAIVTYQYYSLTNEENNYTTFHTTNENYKFYLGEIILISNDRKSLSSYIISNHPLPLGNFRKVNIDPNLNSKLSILEGNNSNVVINNIKMKVTILCTSVDLQSKEKIYIY